MGEQLIRAGFALLTVAAGYVLCDRLGPHAAVPSTHSGHSQAPVVSPDKADSVG